MGLSTSTIEELGRIIQEDYDINLPKQKLFEVANSLVGVYDLLLKFNCEDLKLLQDSSKRKENVYETQNKETTQQTY